MRLLLIIAVVIGLAACTAPSRDFRGLPAQRITVEGSVFDVRVRGERAEAVRVNTQYAPRFGPIRARAGRAMAQASGCEVKEVLDGSARRHAPIRRGWRWPVLEMAGIRQYLVDNRRPPPVPWGF